MFRNALGREEVVKVVKGSSNVCTQPLLLLVSRREMRLIEGIYDDHSYHQLSFANVYSGEKGGRHLISAPEQSEPRSGRGWPVHFPTF